MNKMTRLRFTSLGLLSNTESMWYNAAVTISILCSVAYLPDMPQCKKEMLHHKVTSKLPEMLTYLFSQLEEIQTGTKCKCSVFGKAAKYLKLIQLVVQTEIPTKLSDQHITIFFPLWTNAQ